jgi:hypothetical protein
MINQKPAEIQGEGCRNIEYLFVVDAVDIIGQRWARG